MVINKNMKTYVEKKKKEGKVQLICWIDKTTAKEINKLKGVHNCRNKGEVIDVLVGKKDNKVGSKTVWQEDIRITKEYLKKTISDKLKGIETDISFLRAEQVQNKGKKILNRNSKRKNKLIVEEDGLKPIVIEDDFLKYVREREENDSKIEGNVIKIGEFVFNRTNQTEFRKAIFYFDKKQREKGIKRKDIAELLNKNGVPPDRGEKWNFNALKAVVYRAKKQFNLE